VESVTLSAAEKERLQRVVMTLEALYNVVKNNPGIGSLSILGPLCVFLPRHMNVVYRTGTLSNVQIPVLAVYNFSAEQADLSPSSPPPPPPPPSSSSSSLSSSSSSSL